MGKDPFQKVRQLINDLITKLEEEATAEASEKEFCEDEMSKETTNRDNAKTEEEKTAAKINRGEAKIKALQEQIAAAEQEIVELNKEATEAVSLREEEKTDNDQTLADASEGLEAVRAAITVLNEYYSKNGQFLQQDPESPVEGTPEEYASSDNTGQANQVVGFLEVIKSDFERTIKAVEAAEAESLSDYNTAKSARDGQVSSAEASVQSKSSELDAEKTTLFDDEDELADHKKDVSAAVEALEKLKPQCVDQSVTYEERTARRKQEIDSLQQALKILEESANVGFLQGK
jgi:chromosome segregation ATPase